MPIGIVQQHVGRARVKGVVGNGQLLAHQHTGHVFHAPHAPGKAHLQELADLGGGRLMREQLAGKLAIHHAQLCGQNLQPLGPAGCAVAAVNAGAVVPTHPLRSLGVDPVNVGHMGELEAAFKAGFNNVVRVLYLPLGTWVARLIDDQVDLQAPGQVLKRPARPAARVHHQVKRHAVHLLLRALGHGGQQQLGHVGHAFATLLVQHKDAAAGVVGDDPAQQALALDLLEVFGLVFVKLARRHVLHPALPLAGHIKQGANRKVQLPHLVGVVAAQLLGRRCAAQLIRVQCIRAQGAGAGAFR